MVDRVVNRHGTRVVAEAYLTYLYSPEGQETAATKRVADCGDVRSVVQLGVRMSERVEKRSGFPGQRRVILPESLIRGAIDNEPLLAGLLATGAGYFPNARGHLRRSPIGTDQLVLLYCVKGAGWCEVARRPCPVRAGDLVVLPPGLPHSYGANETQPWTLYWAHAAGNHISEYVRKLAVPPENPMVRIGEDLQITLLFDEVLKNLEIDFAFPRLLQAAYALAHLIALVIQLRHQKRPDIDERFQRVGKCIEYMSEHLNEPLKVRTLASLAALSTAHFTVVFKEQTGSTPRTYLHLLRMHRACQWLTSSRMSLKEIAACLGYQDQFHFSRKFKGFTGVAPSEYRAGNLFA